MINFDASTHTYTRNNQTYISVTTLLKKYNLSPNYTNIPQDVLSKASQRGNSVHKDLENYIKSGIDNPNNNDLQNFIKYVTNRNINLLLAKSEEVIYDDNYLIAGTVDWQYIDGDEDVIADFKTTSSIHWDSVSWQLSIYNYIKCKGDVLQYYLKKLKVVHMYNGKFSVREVPPIEYDEIVNLLNANLAGLPYIYTPDYSKIMSNSESLVLGTLLDDIAQCETLLQELTAKREEMQKKLIERMILNNKRECTINNIYIKYTDGATRQSLDLNKVKQLCDSVGMPIDKLYKISNVKPKLTINKKGN